MEVLKQVIKSNILSNYLYYQRKLNCHCLIPSSWRITCVTYDVKLSPFSDVHVVNNNNEDFM